MGQFPLLIRNEELEPIGGVDLQIIETLAKKFDFKPRFMPATSFNMLVDMVIVTCKIHSNHFILKLF